MLVASYRCAHPPSTARAEEVATMNAWRLRLRHQPPRLQAHWMLLLAALASLAVLVLACMLADPGPLMPR